MSILFLDFESFYSSDYSLSQMTPPEYVLDPRWETIGCAAAVDNEASHFVDGPDFGDYIKQFDPRTTTTVCFNALFDNCILAWRYGFVPARMFCTMRMAAALRGDRLMKGASLKQVGKLLNIGEKGDIIHNVKGMRRAEIMNDPFLWLGFQAYAINDNDMSRRVFDMLLPEFPASERRVMDRVLRCAIEPRFHIDQPMLDAHMIDLEQQRKVMLMQAAGIAVDEDQPALGLGDEAELEIELNKFASTLRSNDKFKAMLEKHGVDVEMKKSLTDPDREIPAFAKTDQFMSDLQEHEDEAVQALATARLGLRSTIEQSRGARIQKIAALPWPPGLGQMPIPLRYSGAHTHRLSGDWKVNMQNLPAGRGKNKSKLRKALIAPPGFVVLVADLSQIECRINAWLCGQQDLIDIFANKLDPYSVLASSVFGFKVDKKVHLIERFIGKGGVLGLGFGCGAAKFYNMVVRSGRLLGMDMSKLMSMWSPELAQKTVDIYRNQNRGITTTWRVLDNIIKTSWSGVSGPVKFGPGGVVEIGHGYVMLPNGMKMLYQPFYSQDDEGWRYRYGNREFKMYGSKFLENIVQALARIVIMNAALRLWDRGLKFCLQAHDELAFIVPEAEAETAKATVLEEMRRRPSWALNVPLDAEANYGKSYGDAK